MDENSSPEELHHPPMPAMPAFANVPAPSQLIGNAMQPPAFAPSHLVQPSMLQNI